MSMKCAVPVEARDMAALAAQESHGKRADFLGQARRVRDVEPLVYGGLNLRELFDKHAAGCRRNKALKSPVLHLICQLPTSINMATPGVHQAMMNKCLQFAKRVYGPDAVFAARMDRDEKSEHVVDLFLSPKYTKVTKTHGEQVWISTTKQGKALCRKHAAEIQRRNEGTFVDNPRAVGMLLQSEFIAFWREAGINVDDKREKESPVPDRLEPEVYAAKRIAEAKAAERKARQTEAEVEEFVAKRQRKWLSLKRAIRKAEEIYEATKAKLADLTAQIKEAEQRLAALLSDVAEAESREGMLDAVWRWNRDRPEQAIKPPVAGPGVERQR